MPMWLVARIESDLEWPAEETTVKYLDYELLLRPPNDTQAADICIKFADGESFESSAHYYEIVRRFLSAMAWWYGSSASIVWSHVSSFPTRIGKGPSQALIKHFKLPEELPTPADDKAQLAIALYREATSSKHITYEFLGYFKIINIIHDKGKDQIAWIDETLPKIRRGRAKRYLEELEKNHTRIGKYLYEEGRCAVAHAFADPIVNPDRSEDRYRLGDALAVMKALAEYIIVEEFGVHNYMSSKGARYNY